MPRNWPRLSTNSGSRYRNTPNPYTMFTISSAATLRSRAPPRRRGSGRALEEIWVGASSCLSPLSCKLRRMPATSGCPCSSWELVCTKRMNRFTHVLSTWSSRKRSIAHACTTLATAWGDAYRTSFTANACVQARGNAVVVQPSFAKDNSVADRSLALY